VRLSYRARITILTIFAVAIPVVLIQYFSINLQQRIAEKAESELMILAETNIKQIAKDAYSICEASNEMISSKNSLALKLLSNEINKKGGFQLSKELVEWKARNQYTNETKLIKLPKLLAGSQWFGQVEAFSNYSLIVDDVTKIVGGTVTIFQRINGSGDMLRVSTTVPNSDGNRAIGTFIPAINPDGTNNTVVEKILKGERYFGMAYVVNDWYGTIYEPIYDKDKHITGMIYSGEKLNTIQTLRKALKSIKVGKTGYVFVLGTIEPHKGRYIISKDGTRDGDYILDETDASGRKFVKELSDKAVKLKSNETITFEYTWRNPNDSVAHNRVAALVYFEQWGWIIGASTYEEDYYDTKDSINSILGDLRTNLIIIATITLVLIVIIASFISKKMTTPLLFITKISDKIADGYLAEAKALIEDFKIKHKLTAINKTIRDEALILMFSFDKMLGKLESLIGQVQKSGIQVSSTVNQISASARELEATIAEQAALTNEVSASSREIAQTSQRLANTTDNLNHMATDTNNIAIGGLDKLDDIRSNLDNMLSSSTGIYEKLDIIKNKTKNINNIVTAITKVANQTNLLSLNASIEAERAGDAGSGFAIVAREIRRLADQTSIAALDIEKLIQEMQKAVSEGTEFIITYTNDNKKGAEKVNQIMEEIKGIIERISLLPNQVSDLKLGMDNQSESATQISDSMKQLNSATQQTRDAVYEFNSASKNLRSAIENLNVEIQKFHI